MKGAHLSVPLNSGPYRTYIVQLCRARRLRFELHLHFACCEVVCLFVCLFIMRKH